MGHGHKFEVDRSVYPCNPPQLMADAEEYGDQPEPNPLKEPVVEEKKPEEGDEQEEQEDEDN